MSDLGIRRKRDHDREPDVILRIRRQHQRMVAASTRLFELPGYDGQVMVRYQRLGHEDLKRVLLNEDTDVVGKNAQFLIDACDEILYREEDGTLVPVVAGCKTTFEFNPDTGSSFGTVLGIDHIDSIQGQVVAAFAGNEHALLGHADEVSKWMVAANAADDETLVGESGRSQP